MRHIAMFALLCALAGDAHAQATTVFRGRPLIKVSEAGRTRVPEELSRNEAINLECVISQIGDEYYWASRENVRMVRIQSGAFITYVAVTGAGYVRIIPSDLKAAASLMSETEAEFDYVEHAIFGLGSVTYWGKRQP